jgi:hypothetical protein
MTGKDYLNADGLGLKTLCGFIWCRFTYPQMESYDDQFTFLNTALQFGKRGSAVNNITESYFQFSLGISLSDIWFMKRKYD